MLTINKSTTVEGVSTTEDDRQIAMFYASLNETGTNITMNVSDQVLYEANKKQVRADKRKFDDYVYELEDEAEESV